MDGRASAPLGGDRLCGTAGKDVWLNDNATFPNTTLAPNFTPRSGGPGVGVPETRPARDSTSRTVG